MGRNEFLPPQRCGSILHPPALPASLPAHLAQGGADGRGARGAVCWSQSLGGCAPSLSSSGAWGASPGQGRAGRDRDRDAQSPSCRLCVHPSSHNSRPAWAVPSQGFALLGCSVFLSLPFSDLAFFNQIFWLIYSPTFLILFLLPFTFLPSAPSAAQLFSLPPALTLLVFSSWSCQQPSGTEEKENLRATQLRSFP